MPSWLFVLFQMRRRLWLTVTIYSGVGLAAALIAAQFGRYVPADFPLKIGSDAVDDILGILASSMLAVATFSLTTLVTAYTSVVSTASSRAARLLVADGGIRNALATFVGAFIYSIVGIIALHTRYYGDQGRVILFFVTIGVLVLVVVAMLRWIAQLTDLGQTHKVVERVAKAASSALAAKTTRLDEVAGHTWSPPNGATAVCAGAIGFVQNIDLESLHGSAEKHGLRLWVEALPGALVHEGQALLLAFPAAPPDCVDELKSFFTVGSERTHDQDPRYGLQILGEIAARALSPGVNDPGTAREVLARTTLLLRERQCETEAALPDERVQLKPMQWSDVLEQALRPIVVHGAADLHLQVMLQQCLHALTFGHVGLASAARQFAAFALEEAMAAIPGPADRDSLRRAALG